MSNETRIVITADGKAAIDGLNAVTQKLKETTDQAKTSSKSMIEGWRDYATAINQSFGVLGTAAGVLKDIYKTTKEGAELAEQRQQFTALAASYGVYADAVIEASRRATTGQVADAELIANTMAAMRQNVSRNQNELAKLWEIAEVKSDQFGGTVSENFRKITDAIATGNGRSLVSLGLLPESMGRASSAAQLLERRGKLLSDVFTQFGEDTTTSAEAGDSAADSFNRLEASWANLKNEGTQLLTVLKPVVDLVSDFISLSRKLPQAFAAMQNPNDNAFLNVPAEKGMNAAQTREYLKNTAKYNNDMLQRGTLSEATQTKLLNQNKIIAQLLRTKSLEEEMDRATEARAKTADALYSNIANGNEKAGKAAKAHKDQIKDLLGTYESFQKKVNEMANNPNWATGMSGFAGGFSFDVAGVVDEAKRLNEEFEKLVDSSMDIADEWGDIAGEIEKAFDEGDEGLDKTVEEFGERAGETIREPIQINVADAFAAGMNEALLNGGNFFKAFGDALKRQLVNALTQSLTGSIFGGGGGNILGYVGGSGTVYGSGSAGGAATVGGSGLLGNLFNTGPLMKNGAFQFGNFTQMLGTSAAVGFVANRLFGQGGLFGGRVIHGAEAINQAADINTQVQQAKDQREQALSTLGMSDDTFKQLKDLVFWTAGYSASKSGDGIFSKKTTTYALDATKANEALKKYGELIAQATAEAAAREYEKQFAAIDSPTKALAMTIEDLQKVVERTGDQGAALQLAQAQATIRDNEMARAGNWFDYMLANPQVGSTSIYNWGMSSAYGESAASVRRPPNIRASLRVQPPEWMLNASDSDLLQNYDILQMYGGLKNQAATNYNIDALGISAQSSPEKMTEYLQAREDAANERIKTSKSLMDDAEKKITDMTYDLKTRTAAFEDYQNAQSAYYAAKLEALTVEQQQQAAIKAKQDSLKNDRISDALTFLGEIRERGGQQVLIISGGSPDTVSRLKQIRDGLDADGAAVVQQIIDRYSGTSSNPALRL